MNPCRKQCGICHVCWLYANEPRFMRAWGNPDAPGIEVKLASKIQPKFSKQTLELIQKCPHRKPIEKATGCGCQHQCAVKDNQPVKVQDCWQCQESGGPQV